MLSQLYIENIAVMEKVSVGFHPGFSVLTGETGAGKSILIDSINAILGERTSRDLVRAGSKSALVSASFTDLGPETAKALQKSGYAPDEEGTLILEREFGPGKSSCRVNGRPVTVSVLRKIGPLLVNIHGQHESYGLLSPENHLRYLDSMGIPEDLLNRYRRAYGEMRRVRKELGESEMDKDQKARKTDLLTYQINELEAADFHPGEQEELTRKENLYRNSQKITADIQKAKEALEGDEESGGAASAVSMAAEALLDASGCFPELKGLAERLQSISYDLEDCGRELGKYGGEAEFDPGELEKTESRLDFIYQMGLKYGGTVEKMLEYLGRIREELRKISLSDETAARLREEYEKDLRQAEKLAGEISEWRRNAAEDFEKKVESELNFLNMPDVVFQVRIQKCPLGPDGCDSVEFLISANPGEPVRPIAKIASGGELSRIMLAVKTVLARRDSVGTLIFDEIDAGVSGKAAQKVGLKLREVSSNRQVICVTHLAQIAALADFQYLIDKQVEGGRTRTRVRELDDEGRKRELARIIGGAQITPLTLENAAEMLRLARRRGDKS